MAVAQPFHFRFGVEQIYTSLIIMPAAPLCACAIALEMQTLLIARHG